jgi:hypothetical protein
MIVDRGTDFPPSMQESLQMYGFEMWFFRDQADCVTTRALNSYRGDHRKFRYLSLSASGSLQLRLTVLNISPPEFELRLTTY